MNMTVESWVAGFAAVMLFAGLAHPLARLVRLPVVVVLAILGLEPVP